MNSFKRHIYKNSKVKQKITLLTLTPTSANLLGFLPDDTIVQVRSNSSWLVGPTPNWFSISSGGVSGNGDGLFIINTQSNSTNNSRSYLLNVTAGEVGETVTKTFFISQGAFIPTLTLDPSSKILPETDPSNFNVNVTSNTSWIVGDTPDWFSVGGGNDNNSGFGSGNGFFTIIPTDNTTGSNREYDLIVTAGTEGNTITKVFSLSQIGVNKQITISPEFKDTNRNLETYPITITSNASWTITIPDEFSWITADEFSGSNNGSVNVTVSKNETDYERTGEVIFATDDVPITHTVTQEGIDVSNLKEYTVSKAATSSEACNTSPSIPVFSNSDDFGGSEILYENIEGSSRVGEGFYRRGIVVLEFNNNGERISISEDEICTG
jgi:hypothetical protein